MSDNNFSVGLDFALAMRGARGYSSHTLFFVLEPTIFDYIEDDATVFERGPMEALS